MTSSGRKRAFLSVEIMVALAVLGVLMVAMAVTLYGVRRFHQVLWVRQQCMAAAEAQIDSLMATGFAIDPNRIEILWPRLKVETQVRPGQGPWQGLDLVRATASIHSGRRIVSVTLARYGTIRTTVVSGEWLVTSDKQPKL